MRCTKCKNVWFQENLSSASGNLKTAAFQYKPSMLPVVVEYVTPFWFKLLPMMFTFLVVFTACFIFHEDLVKKLPLTNTLYEKAGVGSIENMTLQHVTLNKLGDGSVELVGYILNKSNTAKTLPSLVVSVLTKDSKKVKSFIIKHEHKQLESGQRHPFYRKFTNIPNVLGAISVSIADKTDLFLDRI